MYNNKKVSVLHVIEKLSDEEGGLYNMVKNLCKFLPRAKNYIITSQIKNNKILNNFSCKVFKLKLINIYYKKLLLDSVDIVHIHGIWSIINTIIAITAFLRGIPYVVSPHGMLEPWSLEQKSFKKKIALFLFWNKILHYSNYIIFSSVQEYKNFLKINNRKNFNYRIIPNGCEPIREFKKNNVKNRKKNLLFLSRLHEKKGIINLINVFKELNPSNWNLRIAGSGKKSFLRKLLQLSRNNYSGNNIQFLGFADEKKKKIIFKNSDIFVLPSYSENFGIVVAEALSYGLPVLTTKNTPWSILSKYKCGWCIKNNKKNLKIYLSRIFKIEDKIFIDMSKNAKKLSNQFKWPIVANKFNNLYIKVLYNS
jgi:glycosyltransferase involved in cell wall biosynthesis